MSVNGGAPFETGLTINGREPSEVVTLEVDQMSRVLTVAAGEGVAEYAFVSPAIASGDRVMPGTEVVLSVRTKENYKNVELISKPAGLRFRRVEDTIVFTMPVYDVKVTLVAARVHRIDYMYNYGDMGVYKTAYATEDEALVQPVPPAIKGLTFRGWYKKANCSGSQYEFGKTLKEDLTLYADWTCNVTVDFGAAKGQAAYYSDGRTELIFDGDSQEYSRFTYSTLRVGKHPLDIAVPNHSGHNFKGWYLNPDFTGEPVNLKTYVLEGGVTLYARWAKLLSIDYDWNYRGMGIYGAPWRNWDSPWSMCRRTRSLTTTRSPDGLPTRPATRRAASIRPKTARRTT
jgi:hypothetical protein